MRRPDAGRHVGAHEVDGRRRTARDEFILAEVHAPALGIAHVDPRGSSERADHRAIFGGDLAEILRADQTAGAIHVLDHEVRRAVNVLDEVAREQAALDIGRPARGKVDEHRNPLALVVGLLRGGRRRSQTDRGTDDCKRGARADR